MKHFWLYLLREGEGKGGGAGEGGEGGGGSQGGADFIPQGLDLGELAKPTAPETIGALHEALQTASKPPYDAEKLGDEYKGKQPAEVFTQMQTRIEGLRSELGKRGEIPKTAEEYVYEPSEKAKGFIPERAEGEADPVMEIAKQAALKHQLPVPAFNGFVNDMYEMMAEKGLMAAPINPKAELADFGKFAELPDEVAVSKRVDELTAFGKSFAEKYKLGDDGKLELEVMTDTAGGLKVLNTLQTVLRERGIELGGDPAGATTMTDEEFKRLSGSDEIDPMHKDYSPEKRKQWEIESNRRTDLKQRAG